MKLTDLKNVCYYCADNHICFNDLTPNRNSHFLIFAAAKTKKQHVGGVLLQVKKGFLQKAS